VKSHSGSCLSATFVLTLLLLFAAHLPAMETAAGDERPSGSGVGESMAGKQEGRIRVVPLSPVFSVVEFTVFAIRPPRSTDK